MIFKLRAVINANVKVAQSFKVTVTVDCTNSIVRKSSNPAVMTYTKDYFVNAKSTLIAFATQKTMFTLTFPNDC